MEERIINDKTSVYDIELQHINTEGKKPAEAIKELLESSNGRLKLNSVTCLKRWKKNVMGDDVDCLDVEFRYVIGVRGGKQYEIQSREIDGIFDEIAAYTEDYLSECLRVAAKKIRNREWS